MKEQINKNIVTKVVSSDKKNIIKNITKNKINVIFEKYNNSSVTNNNSLSINNNIYDKLSTINFYIIMLVQKSAIKLTNVIRNYVDFINNKDCKNYIYYLFLLLINLGKCTTDKKKFYYHILKELTINHYPIVFKFLLKFPPKYGTLINFKKICCENTIDDNILDIFKLSLNIIEKIDEQILIDNLNVNLNYDNSMLFDLEIINANGNHEYFIEILKNRLSNYEIVYINMLIFENIFVIHQEF